MVHKDYPRTVMYWRGWKLKLASIQALLSWLATALCQSPPMPLKVL